MKDKLGFASLLLLKWLKAQLKEKKRKKISKKKHPGNFSASAVCDVHMCMYVKIGGATKAKEMLTYGDVEHELGLNVSLLFLFALPDIVCEPEWQ